MKLPPVVAIPTRELVGSSLKASVADPYGRDQRDGLKAGASSNDLAAEAICPGAASGSDAWAVPPLALDGPCVFCIFTATRLLSDLPADGVTGSGSRASRSTAVLP